MVNNKLIYNPQLKDNFQFVFQGDINGTINTVALFVDGNKVGDSLITTDGESYFLNVPAGLWSVIGTNVDDFINLFPDSSKIEVRRDADGFSGSLTWEALTDARTWTMPNKTGVVAMTSDIQPASFTTEKTSIAGSAAGAWITRSLGAGYANKLIRVTMENDSVALRKAGVREVGDANDLSFHMGRCHSSFEVVADGAGDIQIYSDDLSVDFWITGTKTI